MRLSPLSSFLAALVAINPCNLVQAINPVLPGLWADPNIAVFNGTYYLFTTTDGYPSWSGQIFYVWKSLDLVHWTSSPSPILTLNSTSGNVAWSSGSAWAPTIVARNGKFYFYFSGHNPVSKAKNIGVAVAENPEGPYTAQVNPMITGAESIHANQAIDPYAFHDPVSGRYYLIWGNGRALIAELSTDMLNIIPSTLQPLSGFTSYREAPFVAHHNGIYHFTYAINDTGSEYYATGYATSPNLSGPYTDQYPILQLNATLGILGTGGSTLVEVPGTDHWYIAYHRLHIPGGDGTHRETCIDRLYFNDKTGLIEKVIPTLDGVEGEVVPAR